MSPIFFLWILQRIILCMYAIAAPVSMMQDGKLISEIGNLFAEALRGLSDDEPEPERPAAVLQAFDAPQQKLIPGEADRKEHAARTQTLAAAIQSWVTQVCQLDETQQGQLAELVTERLKTEAERYAKQDNPNRQNRPFGETTPVLFVQPDNIGANFSTQMLNLIREKILNDAQKEKLNLADTERRDFQRAAFREYVVALFDQELFLTAEQRRKMLEHFSASPKLKINSPFYSFVAQTYYLPYQPLSGVLSARNTDFLNPRQKDRLKDLTSAEPNGNQNYIMFQSSEGPEQWAENVKVAAVRQRQTYLHAAAVRIDYFERSLKLTPEQSAYLTVASKGATTVAISDWKEATQQTIDQMQAQMGQMQGNFAFSAQMISIDGLDNNEIWANAIREVQAHGQTGVRSLVIRRAEANTVTALLDQELWLLPEQRAAVQEFTEDAMPHSQSKSHYDDYVRELVLLAYPLKKVPGAKVKDVLSEPQQVVWMRLKDFFRWDRGNNTVEIPMKNQGGGFQVQLSD
ncbi:MAG: hypothetical protein WKF77_01460 [Planctomycetaceae bacterium]